MRMFCHWCPLCALSAFFLGFNLGGYLADNGSHSTAIQQHCAHYDSLTGEFKWGVEPTP